MLLGCQIEADHNWNHFAEEPILPQERNPIMDRFHAHLAGPPRRD
jgi:hypothetical protein